MAIGRDLRGQAFHGLDGSRYQSDRCAVASQPFSNCGPQTGSDADLVVRPEALEFTARPRPDALPGEVAERRYAGRVAYFRVVTEAAGEIEVLAPPLAARDGDRVLVVPAPGGPVPRVFPRAETE